MMGEMKKGPWKAEEDEVLINHVKKYGPKDWSSIRSKGLLRRTGKSCRLRWVNKLRPDLKKYVCACVFWTCKFGLVNVELTLSWFVSVCICAC